MNLVPQSKSVKRRIVYVDDKVQKGLLIALVTLEVLLIAATLWMLYVQLGAVVDAKLYRVHFIETPNIYPLLLKTALIGVVGLIAVNALMLWVAGWVWARHVDSILQPFRELIGKVESLDFSVDESVNIPHNVVSLALTWRDTKRQNLLRLRQEIARLDEFSELPDVETRRRASEILKTIRGLLPKQ
ncbi:MAG: hypothetical protein WAW75_06070 [Gallionella sp.]